MKLSNSPASFLRFTVLTCAILVGAAAGGILVPVRLFARIHPSSTYAPSLCVIAAGVASFACIGLWLLNWTENKEHQLNRDLLDTFLEYIPDNVFFKDKDSRFVRISHSMARYCGLEHPSQAIYKTDAEFFSSEHAAEALADERKILATGQSIADKEEKETWPDGRETWVLTTKVAMRDRSGQVIGTMGIAHNITDRKEAEIKVRHMALHDALTGLPNRILLEDRLTQAFSLARRNQTQVAVLMFDLDRFKYVNDSFGHYVGDRLLQLVAARLNECIRQSDTIARLGGDEFVVALHSISGIDKAELVANKIVATIARPFEIAGHQLHVGASIGICLFPDDGDTPELLLQHADAAMYEAKRRGRNQHCFFSPAFTEATKIQQRLESELMQACEQKQFVLHYQPFIDAKSGRITGVETLLRWRHPQFGLVPPARFIPALEELGLIVELGRWVLRTACREAVEWQRRGMPRIRVAVNISSRQFYQEDFVGTIESVLADTGLDPQLLELELTENRILDDSENTINIMHRLKHLGITLSLDDFGTGWSSLAYLRRFPVDRIKIDQSFVRDLGIQPGAAAVVKSILGLGRNLGMACIAEGVETANQSRFLSRRGCEEMQGYLFSPPLPAADMMALLRSEQFAGQRLAIEADTAVTDAYPPALELSV